MYKIETNTHMKNKILISLLLLGISVLLFSCAKDDLTDDDENNYTPPAYQDYYGKWEITSVSQKKTSSTRESGLIKNLAPTTIKLDAPNLTFHKPDDWPTPVVIGDNNSPVTGDYCNVKWGIKNTGDQTFNGYVDYEIYYDGEYLVTLPCMLGTENLDPNTYVTDFWGSAFSHPIPPVLTEGNHSLKIIIVSTNLIGNQESNLEDNEYLLNFYVAPPEIKYTSFEFSTNRYIVYDKGNTRYYGKFSASGNSYSLNDFPASISNIQVTGDVITFDLAESKSNTVTYTGKLYNRVRVTSVTTMLMDGPWILQYSDHLNPQKGQGWVFSAGGAYTFENVDGGIEAYEWDERDNNSFYYYVNGEGIADIIHISGSALEVRDESGLKYSFTK